MEYSNRNRGTSNRSRMLEKSEIKKLLKHKEKALEKLEHQFKEARHEPEAYKQLIRLQIQKAEGKVEQLKEILQ